MLKKPFVYLNKHKKLKEALIILFIFSVSLFIRRIGMKHGFPLLTHPDEATIIDSVMKMTKNRTLNSGNFDRPDQILNYLNLLYLNLVSLLSYRKDLSLTYQEHYLDFYFHGRLLTSVLGSFIPIVAYKIGKEFTNSLAFACAGVFAVFPLYFEHSVYITPDVPITLFTLIVIYFTIRYLKCGKQKFLILATIFSAINTAEKYPGLISFGIILCGLIVYIIRDHDTDLKTKLQRFLIQSLKYLLIFIVALFIVAPYIFIEYNSVIQALIQESRSTHLGADRLSWAGNIFFYLQASFSYSNYLSILFIGIAIYAIVKSRKHNYWILLYGFIYWIILSKLALHWERWALPMYTAPLFLISLGISTLWEKLRNKKITKAFSVAVILVFFLQQSVFSLSLITRMKFTDTRVISSSYCEQNDITQNNSIYEGYTPLLPQHPLMMFDNYTNSRDDYDFVILSSSMYNRYYAEPERYQSIIEIYETIRQENTLLTKIEPEPTSENIIDEIFDILYYIKYRLHITDEVRYKGPTIEIYKIVD